MSRGNAPTIPMPPVPPRVSVLIYKIFLSNGKHIFMRAKYCRVVDGSIVLSNSTKDGEGVVAIYSPGVVTRLFTECEYVDEDAIPADWAHNSAKAVDLGKFQL